jgi:Ca2+-binding EF-hand superfamily protein
LVLHRHRAAAQKQLAQSPDFIKVRAFDNISRGMSQISVGDLTYFLERNGFYPRREDIESILRRLDHNGDQSLSYVDFCELTTI